MSDAHGVARDQLRSFIERIERLEEEKKTIADDIKDVYGEAKGMGFEVKILKEVIKIRKMDRDERAEREAILDTYLAALGMIEQPGLYDDEPYDAATGELSPNLAHTIVTGVRTETGPKALITAVDIMIEREEAVEQNTPDTAMDANDDTAVVATSNVHGGAGVGMARTEATAVAAGETAPNSPSEDDAIAAVKGKARLANVVDVEPLSPVPIRQMTASDYRPNCLRPDACGASGLRHCYSCEKSMSAGRESEEA